MARQNVRPLAPAPCDPQVPSTASHSGPKAQAHRRPLPWAHSSEPDRHPSTNRVPDSPATCGVPQRGTVSRPPQSAPNSVAKGSVSHRSNRRPSKTPMRNEATSSGSGTSRSTGLVNATDSPRVMARHCSAKSDQRSDAPRASPSLALTRHPRSVSSAARSCLRRDSASSSPSSSTVRAHQPALRQAKSMNPAGTGGSRDSI